MPRIHLTVIRILAILFLARSLNAAAPPPLHLKWSQLAGAVIGQHVVVELKNHSQIKAVVTTVEESALTLQVTSNSNERYKKGQVAIPRESVAGLRLIHMRVRGRIISTSVGAFAGTVAGGVMVFAGENCFILGCGEPDRGLQVAGVAVWAGVPIAMYFLGKHWDRQEIPIILLPD